MPSVALNCDCSKKCESSRAGASSLLRDHEGRWLGRCCRNIGICSSHQAKLWALWDGLTLTWSLGYRDVVVQNDCLLALNLVRNLDNISHASMSLVRRIKQLLLAKDQRISISHVFRDGNRCADYLASYALNLDIGNHLLQEAPNGLREVLQEDADGVGRTRLCFDANRAGLLISFVKSTFRKTTCVFLHHYPKLKS